MKNLDVLRSQGINVFMVDGALRFSGPEGSKEIVAASMRDRVHQTLVRAGHLRPEYRHASVLNVFDGRPGFGACELCAAQMQPNRSGTCIFCVEVVKRALALDDDARVDVIDTETTGRNPSTHGVIEMACVVLDRRCKTVLDKYEVKMPIHPAFDVDPTALRINGYTPTRWANATPHAEAFARLATMIRPHDIVLGWNLPFDIRMLRGTAAILKLPMPQIVRAVDALRVLSPILRGKMTENMKLATVTSRLGIDHTETHSAMGDVDPLVKVWQWYLQQQGGV